MASEEFWKKAFEEAVRYIEDDVGCCPQCYDYEFGGNCYCPMWGEHRGTEGYDKEKSVNCWERHFLDMVAKEFSGGAVAEW